MLPHLRSSNAGTWLHHRILIIAGTPPLSQTAFLKRDKVQCFWFRFNMNFSFLFFCSQDTTLLHTTEKADLSVLDTQKQRNSPTQKWPCQTPVWRIPQHSKFFSFCQLVPLRDQSLTKGRTSFTDWELWSLWQGTANSCALPVIIFWTL